MPMTPKERYELAREQIKHEDGLVSSRVTWLQVFQGLLFTAFTSGIGLLKEPELLKHPGAATGIALALVMLSLLGIASAFVAYKATAGALAHLKVVEDWWKATPPPAEFPPVRGESGFAVKGVRVFGSKVLLAFAVAWIILVTIFLVVALR